MESLLAKVKEHFPKRSTSCMNNVLILVACMLKGSSVNLYKLRRLVPEVTGKTDTLPDSCYKRLIRIFDKYSFSCLWLELLFYVFRLLRLKSDYLYLDGTSWKHNGRKRHYLTLCFEYANVAVPIYWVDLGKLGISSEKERRGMFRRVFKFYNLKGKVLIADREYIGSDWFKYLVDNDLDFVIRLRHNNYKELIDAAPGRSYDEMVAKVLRSKLPNKAVSKRIVIGEQHYTFVVVKNLDPESKDSVLYLLSSLDTPATAVATAYTRRWKIECCFRHLKSNGFQLEQVNLKGRHRSKLLMAIAVFAYVLSIHEGLKTYRKVRTIKHADGSTSKAVSLFRHGFDNIAKHIYSFELCLQYICREIHVTNKLYRAVNAIIV